MVNLSPTTSIHDLLEEYPFLLDFLADYNPRFGLLKNRALRASAARVATLKTASEMGGVEMDELLGAIRREVERKTGSHRAPSTTSSAGESADREAAGTESVGAHPRSGPDSVHGNQKVAELKSLIQDLHGGTSQEDAQTRFNAVIKDVSPEEIGAMEQELIRDGMPVQEIQRLCDLHVAVVQEGLDRQEPVRAPRGHPVHTYLAENELVTGLANRLGELCRTETATEARGAEWIPAAVQVLDELSGIHNHYLRKENELFPVLERHGITGPSQVMWGVHDEIRDQLAAVRSHLSAGEVEKAAGAGAALARDVVEMVYKENKILLPLALETLTPQDWAEVRRGEDELGYAFKDPAAPFPPPAPGTVPGAELGAGPGGEAAGAKSLGLPIVSGEPTPSLPEGTEAGFVDLGTGRLSVQQVDLLLRHLPVEISFVDADGYVRYYSETEERLFPRTPGAIGRHVENCHPPKSVHMVREILRKFASGERDVAEFWIQMKGRFIHIRYFAVRDEAREYVGCLEVSQDVSDIRALQGQRRLLEWE